MATIGMLPIPGEEYYSGMKDNGYETYENRIERAQAKIAAALGETKPGQRGALVLAALGAAALAYDARVRHESYFAAFDAARTTAGELLHNDMLSNSILSMAALADSNTHHLFLESLADAPDSDLFPTYVGYGSALVAHAIGGRYVDKPLASEPNQAS